MNMSNHTLLVNEFLHIEEFDDEIILSLHKVKSEIKELYEIQIKNGKRRFFYKREVEEHMKKFNP